MPDTPEKSGNQRPDKDRRAHPRQRIHSLSYVKIGDGNGGIVLNISEGGISVQAAALLEAGETVPLWLEIPRVRNRVEVQGEIVWLSESRKEAGLRFVDLEEGTLRKIRKWMEREASPEKFENEPEVVEEEESVPVAAVAAAPVVAEVPAAAREESDVRELTEANVMSAEEIKNFESGRDPVEATARAEESEEIEDEAEEGGEDAGQDGFEDEGEADDGESAEDSGEEEFEHDAEQIEIAASAKRPEEKTDTREAESTRKAAAEEEVEVEPKRKFGFTDETENDGEKESEEEAEESPETEDELIAAFGPPVVPFERRPHTPFTSMSALTGGSARAAQNLAVASTPTLPLTPERGAQATLSESGARESGEAKESDWKEFRVQLHTGWFLAALVLLLALISFIAGMAVRRGALNQVLGEQQDSLIPKSSPVTPHNATAVGGNNAPAANAAPGKPLSIEVVDLANHHWMIPASNGPSRTVTTVAADSGKASDAASPAANANPAGVGATSTGTTGATPNAAKPGIPLVLNLPETPISATGSVAISAQRSVPVPTDGSAAQNGRNLQVGQLLNLVEPVYPPEAIKDRIEGTVKLHAVVGSDGSIQSLTAISGPKALADASLSAVHNWKYSPTRMGGQAIETQEDISFVFRLPN
ncbi:MAG TPA: TonB family protein [Candidatus Acidoferrales bacterium]